MGTFSEETIKSVKYCTERLFSFRVTRPQSLRFRSGEFVGDKLVYYPSVTRDDFERKGHSTTLIDEGVIYDELGIPPLNPETDRVMICGSMEMLEDCKLRCEQAGLTEGSMPARVNSSSKRRLPGSAGAFARGRTTGATLYASAERTP